MKQLSSSCLCGAIVLRLPDAFDYMGHCHCGGCHKFSGADYATLGGLDADKVELMKGGAARALYQKSAEPQLAFCRHCGSSLYPLKLSSGKLNLRLGCLDEAPSMSPGFHLFVGSRAPWHEMNDTRPQFETPP